MYYKYKVDYYCEYTDEEISDEGLVYAKNYGDAAEKVVQSYGEDCVIGVYLYEIYNEGPCLSSEDFGTVFTQPTK